MSVPSQRKSKSKTKRGRSHAALKTPTYNQCPKCKKVTKAHRACSKCGTYKGKIVINTNKKIKKAVKK